MRPYILRCALIGVSLFTCAFNPTTVVAQQNSPPAQPAAPSGMAAPFHQYPDVQKQLNMTPNQLLRMNDLYSQTASQYRRQYNDLGQMRGQERADRLRLLNSDFYSQYSKSLGNILSLNQMERYNQLYQQYRGYDLFAEPNVQKRLNLSTEQQEQLRRADADYQRELTELEKISGTNRIGANTRYGDLARRRADKLNSILSEQQRQIYSAMIGEPYNFPPSWELTTNPSKK